MSDIKNYGNEAFIQCTDGNNISPATVNKDHPYHVFLHNSHYNAMDNHICRDLSKEEKSTILEKHNKQSEDLRNNMEKNGFFTELDNYRIRENVEVRKENYYHYPNYESNYNPTINSFDDQIETHNIIYLCPHFEHKVDAINGECQKGYKLSEDTLNCIGTISDATHEYAYILIVLYFSFSTITSITH